MRFGRQPTETTPRNQMREAIKRMIATEGYKVGDKLPPYRELAERFDVSVMTVQRALRELADAGVIHRLHAKGAFILRIPRVGDRLSTIGLVYPASRTYLVETPYLNQILAGIIFHCDQDEADLQVISVRSARGPVSPHDVATRVDGAILLGVLNDEYVAQFAREGIPVVVVDAETQAAPVHCLAVDNVQVVDLTMDYLHSLGHRRIAYLDARTQDALSVPGKPGGRWLDSTDTRQRRDAYLAAMRRLGLQAMQRIFPPLLDESLAPTMERAVEEWRRDPAAPTAVLCYDASQAALLCQHFAQAGVRVPDDVTVAGAAGAKGEGITATGLVTHAEVDFRDMGWQAVQMLVDLSTGKLRPEQKVRRIGARLTVGTTAAQPE